MTEKNALFGNIKSLWARDRYRLVLVLNATRGARSTGKRKERSDGFDGVERERFRRTGCCDEISTETPLPLPLKDGVGTVSFSTRVGWVVSGILAFVSVLSGLEELSGVVSFVGLRLWRR